VSRSKNIRAAKEMIMMEAFQGIRNGLTGYARLRRALGSKDGSEPATAERCLDDPAVIQVDCRVNGEPVTFEITIRELTGA